MKVFYLGIVMGKGNNRNELCWCGSKLKYKNCHLKKESQKEIQSYEINRNFKNSLKYKTCKVPDDLKHECTKKIIKAHTVSKSANLKNIAKDDEVYGMNIDMYNIKENPKLITLKLKHIDRASIFYIFCSKHDKKLFAPLEDEDFIFSNEQIFLLAYRIVSKAIYLKEQQIKLQEKSKDYDRGIKNKSQQQFIQFIAHAFSDKAAQLNDIQNIKSIFDNDLLNSNYSHIKYYCVLIDKIPEVMSAGAFFPDTDFQGNCLIDYLNNYKKQYNAILTSIIKINDNQGAIIFSWNDSIESDICKVFINSLDILNNEEKAKAIACWLFKRNNENLYISPTWYDNLTHQKKELIQSCYVHDKHLNYQNKDVKELLEHDISLFPDSFRKLDIEEQKKILYNLPIADDNISDFKKFDFFDWNIIDIKTNLI